MCSRNSRRKIDDIWCFDEPLGSPDRADGLTPLGKGDVLVAEEGVGCVLLHVPSGTYLRLDRSATEIFRLVQERGAGVRRGTPRH